MEAVRVWLSYPGSPGHPAGGWCVEWTDGETVYHGHSATSEVLPALPIEVRRPLRGSVTGAVGDMKATADRLATERQAYRNAATNVEQELASVPADPEPPPVAPAVTDPTAPASGG